MNVAICVCTYKRPQQLKNFLDSVANLNWNKNALCVFVADNDSTESAGAKYIENHKNEYDFEIVCGIEEKPGISHARNCSLGLLKNSDFAADYVAFTDDDIVVSPGWLQDLVRVMELYQSDIVGGKTEPLFPTKPKDEILYSSFYTSGFATPPTGMGMNCAGTNNMLVRRSVFEKVGYSPFDPVLSTCGGEDMDFTMSLYKDGYKFTQCSTGVVYEAYPEDRLNFTWINNRYFRSGSTYAYTMKKNIRPVETV